MTTEQELFDIIDAQYTNGEAETDSLHIIDSSELYEDERKYRVYHGNGHCFDIKRVEIYPDEPDEELSIEYVFYDDWDGFKPIDKTRALSLIRKTLKIV